jgi:hypothetical protein
LRLQWKSELTLGLLLLLLFGLFDIIAVQTLNQNTDAAFQASRLINRHALAATEQNYAGESEPADELGLGLYVPPDSHHYVSPIFEHSSRIKPQQPEYQSGRVSYKAFA